MRLVFLICGLALIAPDLDARELSTTVRAARPNADGQTSTRVDAEEFAGEWRHAADLAASAPGVIPMDFGGPLASTTVSLRGGGADQVAVIFDGLPMGSPAGGGFDLSRLPVALFSGLEVHRGTDARLGASAMGGAIVLSPVKTSRAVVTAGTWGTYGASGSHAFDATTPDAIWKILGAVDVRRSAGDFNFHRDPTPEIEGNDELVALSRANNDALLASALARVERRSNDASLSALALVSYAERGLPGPIYSPTPTTRQRDGSFAGHLGWRTASLEIPLSVRAGAMSTSATSRELESGVQSFVDTFTTPSFTTRFSSATLHLDGLAGHEWFVGNEHGNRARLRGGLGVELTAETGRWSGSVALRGERWADAWGIVPRIGGSVRLPLGITFYANAGGGFRPPSFGELYFSSGPVLPNPDLVAERAWSADVGLKTFQSASGVTLTATAAVFAGRYEDTIVYELFSGTRAKPFNLAGSHARGIEAQVSITPDDGPLRPLEVTVSASGLNTTSLVPGENSWHKQLPYRPSFRGATRAAWRGSRVRGAVDFTGTSSAWANRANTRRVDAFYNLGGSAGVRLTRGFWLGAEMRNALDVADRTVIEGYPLPGRTVLAHLSWEPETNQ